MERRRLETDTSRQLKCVWPSYLTVTGSARRAAREALNGSDPTGGALYYYNPDKTSNKWIRSRPVITRIGAHLFCS